MLPLGEDVVMRLVSALVWGLAGLSLCAGAAWAQEPVPPSWSTLVRCAQMPDAAQELACYREAMRAAGYAPPAEAAQARKRRGFGLKPPHLSLPGSAARPAEAQAQADGRAQATAPAEPETVVTVELAQVALIPPSNKLLLVTTDGAVWEQLDSESIAPRPRKGDSMTVRQTRFGGYFCRFGRAQAVRCERTH